MKIKNFIKKLQGITYHEKQLDVDKNLDLYIIDCSNIIYGRLFNFVSTILRDKFNECISFHMFRKNIVILKNLDKITFSNNKDKKFKQFFKSKRVGNSKFNFFHNAKTFVSKLNFFNNTLLNTLPKNRNRRKLLNYLYYFENDFDIEKFFSSFEELVFTKKDFSLDIKINNKFTLKDKIQSFSINIKDGFLDKIKNNIYFIKYFKKTILSNNKNIFCSFNIKRKIMYN